MLRLPELPSQLAFPPSPRPSMQVWDFPITVSLHSLQLPPSWPQTLQAAEPKVCHSLAAHHQPTVFQAAPCFHLPPCGLLPYVLLFRRLDPLPRGFQASPGTPAQVADFYSLDVPSGFHCCRLQNTISAPSCRQAATASLGQAVYCSYSLPSSVAKPQASSHFAVVSNRTGETPGNC